MIRERLAQLIEQIEDTPEYQFESAVVDLTEEICRIMEAKGVTRADLARRLGKSRAYVTKLLRGDRNLTLRTVVEVLWELGYKVNHVPIPVYGQDKWEDSVWEFSSEMDVKVHRIPVELLKRENYPEPETAKPGEAVNVVAA